MRRDVFGGVPCPNELEDLRFALRKWRHLFLPACRHHRHTDRTARVRARSGRWGIGIGET